MFFLQAATVFATCCFLLFAVTTSQNPGTRFTATPPRTITVNLNSDAVFHWTFSFGNTFDRNNFEEIYWGVTSNNDRVRNKYVTVDNNNVASTNNGNNNVRPPLNPRLSSTGYISPTEISQDFVLRSVTIADARKTYGCEALVWGDEFRSGPIRIQVRPSITIYANSINATNGQPLVLQCDATGLPTPYVIWSKGGVVLQNSTATTYSISSVTRADAGSYNCTATNQGGSVSSTIVVNV